MRTILSLMLMLASCGGPGTDAPPAPIADPAIPPATPLPATPSPATPSPATPLPATLSPAAPAAATVELHEWGLVDHDLATGVIELGTGAGEPARPMPMRKPVLYAHLADGVDHAEFLLSATVVGGQVLEHWPATILEGATVRWPHVAVRRGACAGPDDPGARSREASTRDAPSSYCVAPDGFCELTQLASYRTTDHDCLDVGGVAASLLFYRATASPAGLPLAAQRRSDGDIAVTARRSMDGAPGSLVRIRETRAGTFVARAAMPGIGQSIVVPDPTVAAVGGDERSAMDRELQSLGMTASESDAFLRAWFSELFGGPSASGRRAPRVPAERDLLLYWLPEDAVAALSALTVEPAAVRVRRAFLVRVDLGPR